MLADRLATDGHDVTWWSSDFDHIAKGYRTGSAGESFSIAPNYRIELLPGSPYRRNVSLARMRHHRRVARAFAARAATAPAPDVIFSSLPTLEVSQAAVRYGLQHRVPVIVDVRDLWPDAFLGHIPAWLRLPARMALASEYARVRFALRGASGITAVSSEYLAWALRYAGRSARAPDGVFPHGYPRPAFTDHELAEARRQLAAAGVDGRGIVCCFVGSFGRTYDLRPVIATARRMHDGGDRRVQFVFAGDGERRRQFEAEAAGLGNVVFTGWLGAAAITALLDMTDVGLAAYAEHAPQGLPNKIFEYLSAGVPIVSSLRGETARLLAEVGCGFSYDVAGAESFDRALDRLLESEGRRHEMGRLGLARFEAEFSDQVVYRALVAHLVGILQNGTVDLGR